MKKYLVGLLILVSLVVPGVYISAQTVDVAALQAQIAQLQALIAQLQGGGEQQSQCYRFNNNLSIGSTGADVTELQKVLVAKGYLVMPTGVAYGSFDLLVQVAVSKWQVAAGISPATGYVGPVSRAALNSCPTTTTGTVVSNDDMTITLQQADLGTAYNPTRPNTPFLKAYHSFKVTPKKAINLSSGLPRLVSGSNNSPQHTYTTTISGSPSMVDGLYQLQANQEYSITVGTQADSNHMFKGAYKSLLSNLVYKLATDSQLAAYRNITVDQSSNSIAVVGETAPFISSVTQDGDIITIKGVRFNDDVTVKVGDKVIPAKITSGSVGGERKITISQKWFNLPNASQQFSVSDAKGDGNIVYFRVGGGTSNIGSISNVRMTDKSGNNDSGVEQGTNISIAWDTTEKNTIEKVDVLVCWLVSGKENCAISYPNLVNSGKADSVFVWKNVPTGSAYVKVRKAGVDSISGRTADFRVISQPTGGATVKVVSPNGGEVLDQTLGVNVKVVGATSPGVLEILLHDRFGAQVRTLESLRWDPKNGPIVEKTGFPINNTAPGFYKIQAKWIGDDGQIIYDETDGLFEVKTVATIPLPQPSITEFRISHPVTSVTKSTTLVWNTTNTDSCILNGPNFPQNSSESTSAAISTGNLSSTAIYTLTCKNNYGSVSKNLTVEVATSATYHEADTNKDSKIIASELTAYASKVGQYNSSLNVAREIWKKGETYSFNSTSGFYLDAQGKEVYFLLGSKVDNLENNTWTQGQRKSISWHQPVTGVDVLVCRDDTKQCFYAFRNISGGSVSGVLVASNIPATSGTTKKYAYIKVQKSDNPQHAVISDKFEVIAPPVATTQTSSSILGIQAILDGIQSSLNAQ